MRLADIVATSRAVAATPLRREKIDAISTCLRSATGREIGIAAAYLSGESPQGRLGVGWRSVRALGPVPASAEPSLTVIDVDDVLTRVAAVGGAGAQAARQRLLDELLRRATAAEQVFLKKLIVGELRQGAMEAVVVDAVAAAADVAVDEVRRALMVEGDLAAVAGSALTGGAAALAGYGLALGRPVQPMLAQSAESVREALGRLGTAGFEWKIDGARVQVHRRGSEVRVFSRRLNDVTDAVPEVVELVRGLPLDRVILDGEVIALREDPRGDPVPEPFQVTMRRFGRRLDVERLRARIPLSTFAFDCLHLDGTDLVDRPGEQRTEALRAALPESMLVPRLVTADPEAAEAFLAEALARGHEGLLAKSLEAPYEAGRRGAGWLKIKTAHTLDLVVLAAEWGSGRRRGCLSNLHLGARDPDGGFVMLGKTFKGMTDEMLAWQTGHLQSIEVERDGQVVRVRPELVVEIAFDGTQDSPHYPGGMALRFARVKRYRPDKAAADADTIETVRALHGRPIREQGGDPEQGMLFQV